jgi:hypothetical protein
MARKVFYSFHFKPDNWRVAKVRNIGAVEGSQLLSDNDWEAVANKGDEAIRTWISGQMSGTSCQVVLIGSQTAGRKWVKYEIEKAWRDRKGVVGIYIHNLLDRDNNRSTKGANPFSSFKVGDRQMDQIVKAYDPPFSVSTDVYDNIKNNIGSWVEEAIKIRANN